MYKNQKISPKFLNSMQNLKKRKQTKNIRYSLMGKKEANEE